MKSSKSNFSKLDDELNKATDVIDSIFNINEESLYDVFDIIQDYGHSFQFIIRCIKYVMKTRPKQRKILKTLLSKLSKEEECSFKDDIDLFDDKTVKVIIDDDIDEFIKIMASNEFNPQMVFKVKPKNSLFFVTKDLVENSRTCFVSNALVSYMQLMAYFGSAKCFKFALMDGSFDEKGINKYAIAGGNSEIINLLEQKGISFDNCFEISIRYHRDQISEWLLKNYECEEVSLRKCIKFFNNKEFKKNINNKEGEQQFGSKELRYASKKGNLEVIKYLIEKYGADPEQKDSQKRTALFLACENNNIDVVKYLVEECNANINEMSCKYSNFSNYNRTALHVACEKGNIDIVKYLIEECKADPEDPREEVNSFGDIIGEYTSLYIASDSCNFEIIKYLVEECNVKLETISERSLHNAAREGNLELVKYLVEVCHLKADELLEEIDEYGEIVFVKSALHVACENGNIDIVKYLIEECHVNVDIKTDGVGGIKTALHIASEYGYIEIVKYLVEKCHLDVETKTEGYFNEGKTALDFACKSGNMDIIKYLIEECHANTNNINIEALIDAINAKNIDLVKYYIKKFKPNPQEKNKLGYTALQYAKQKKQLNIINYLINDCNEIE